MAVDLGEMLGAGMIEGRLDHLLLHAQPPIFAADAEPLELHEIAEIAQSDRARRIAADIGDELGGAEIVTVEFFLIGAELLGDIGGGTQGEDLGELGHVAHDPNLDPKLRRFGPGLRQASFGKGDEQPFRRVGIEIARLQETDRELEPLRGGGDRAR